MREQLLCRLLELANKLGAGWVTFLFLIAGAALSVALPLARLAVRRLEPNSPAPGAARLVATLLSIGLYALARAVDPLLFSQIGRPPTLPAEVWARVGWFEWSLLGGSPWAWPLLPLEDHPAVGLMIHGALWLVVIATLSWLLARLPGGRGRVRGVETRWDTPEDAVPWYYRWAGATTARRADDRFRRWSRGLLLLLVPLHLGAGALIASAAIDAQGGTYQVDCTERVGVVRGALPRAGASTALPAAGAWVLTYYLLLAWGLQLMLAGHPPRREGESGPLDGDAPGDEPPSTPPPDPLTRLTGALDEVLGPDLRLDPLRHQEAAGAHTAPMPECFGPASRELVEALTDGTGLYRHQRRVLDHILESWRLAPGAGRAPTPSLAEEILRSPVRDQDTSPHALLRAAEGSGRTTLTLLAALHLYFDRGATSLAVLPDGPTARRWAQRLRELLVRSTARWSVHVCIAGEDLSAALVAGKTPAVIVADPETLEQDVLSEPRTDAFLDRLGLLVVDDLDELAGVAEMHMHLLMRRLWALLDTRSHVSRRGYPAVVLATAGPAPPAQAGDAPWARHLLATPLRVFDDDGAPCARQVVLRRRDLVDSRGAPIPIATLAEACERAAIPWHGRVAGDGRRTQWRGGLDRTRMGEHHVEDPRAAEVVLLEGRYPDVHREAARLRHAGAATPGASSVLVLAPPGDDEMALHDEAQDAPLRPLVASLPRSVVLAEPDIVRQRHLERCLGREHDVEALRARFGAPLVDEMLTRLATAGRITERRVWYFDRQRDDVASRIFVRAAGEAALGEPIRRDCVSDSAERLRVIDESTSQELKSVDRAIAPRLFAPGTIFLHRGGRFLVTGSHESAVFVVPCVARWRTTPDVEVRLALPADATLMERNLGGATLRAGLVRGEVEERVLGMRRYGPNLELLEHGRLSTPATTRYVTDICVIETRCRSSSGTQSEPLTPAALLPLTAALRMMLPCALRGAEDLVDVSVQTQGDSSLLAIHDRTPGACGFAAHLAREGLRDLLALTRLALERLVGAGLLRLRHLHDTSPEGRAMNWDFRGALTFLDAVLDSPPLEDPRPSVGPRSAYVSGEGPGDLGRLWISRTGRTDDLVWTRHRWEHDGRPVHFDVAVERRSIPDAIAEAARRGVPRQPQAPRDAGEWANAHRLLLAPEPPEIEAVRRQLGTLAPNRRIDLVLGLVAGIPTQRGPLSPAERAPLAVLARRRGDLDAKVLAALALLREEASAAVLVGPGACLLRVGDRCWDLGGPRPTPADPGDSAAALPAPTAR